MSLTTTLAAVARRYVRAHGRRCSRLLGAAEALSPTGERWLRQKLRLPRELVELRTSPAGSLLSEPLVMETAFGAEQISSLLYFSGWRGFEYPFPLIVETFLRQCEGAFIDIGANTGLYSLLAKSLNPSREVFAFEPLPVALGILRSNLSMNRHAADVRVITKAASDGPGTATLYVPTQEHGLVETSASLVKEFRDSHSEAFQVELVAGDLALEGCRIALIKIDVEGAEGKVLRGLTQTLTRQRPIVLCEVLQETDTWLSVENAISKPGYVAAAILEDRVIRSSAKVPGADNYVLFPRERIDDVERAVISAGLRLD